MSSLQASAVALWLFAACAPCVAAETARPLIGDTEQVFRLAAENTRVRGVAFDDASPEAPRLLVLDDSHRLFCYQIDQHAPEGSGELKLIEVRDLPKRENGEAIEDPRGLAFAVVDGHGAAYFLNWDDSKGEVISELWRVGLDDGVSRTVNLSLYPFRIGDRELLDVAYDDGKILISFDASGYTDHNLRVQRGIIQLQWSPADDGRLEFVRHIPDSGSEPSYGLACMQQEGHHYVWGTVGQSYIYCADARAGRGVFHFDRPGARESSNPPRGLAYGAGALWIPEGADGPDRVRRVNVSENLGAAREGARSLRRLAMTITTEPETQVDDAGEVFHYYSRPYSYEQLHNQGVWPETETIADTSNATGAACKQFVYDPAYDASSRQFMSCVRYANAPSRTYSSRYEIDIWTNTCRKYVYPHLANRNTAALEGTDYLEDDPELFNLADSKTYNEFFERVNSHMMKKYGFPAERDNPYWAARDALEYIQDHYYYPGRSKRKPAAVDYERGHYDANPGNLKLELSNRPYDKTQIIACSGTSVALAGAMRYLGIPARWLGTGYEQEPDEWDTNGNGLLDEDETAGCNNGHRYTQVWLGDFYGWICFDATPSRPDFMDYDPPPPLRSQWRYMNRAAAGHLKERRLVFNVGSRLFRPLYREFEYDEKLAVDNNCGGDQRYNLQGRFEKPRLWRLAAHRIYVKNLCFVEEVTISGPKDKTRVAWKLKGEWDKDPGATLSIVLQKLDDRANSARDAAVLAAGVPYAAKAALVDLSAHHGPRFRIVLRKDGDRETGGQSGVFSME